MVNLIVLYLINAVEHYLQIKVECYYIVWPYSKISEVITDNQKHGSLWETSWWKLLQFGMPTKANLLQIQGISLELTSSLHVGFYQF